MLIFRKAVKDVLVNKEEINEGRGNGEQETGNPNTREEQGILRCKVKGQSFWNESCALVAGAIEVQTGAHSKAPRTIFRKMRLIECQIHLNVSTGGVKNSGRVRFN